MALTTQTGSANFLALMAKSAVHHDLSRRERQILDVLYKAGRATAAEVQEAMPAAPSYSAVRTLLRILEDKGHVRHEQDGSRYIYVPTVARDTAKRSALRHLLNTFFEGSTTQAIAALLDEDANRLSNADWDRLTAEIKRARKEGA
jgi:predicted transcriptional regulator